VYRLVLGPTQWILGALSLGVKHPVSEADHSPPSSAEVKNARSYTSTPQYAFMAWCSIKAQGQLYFYLTLPKRYLDIQKERLLLKDVVPVRDILGYRIKNAVVKCFIFQIRS
jgi:hypothetical protein